MDCPLCKTHLSLKTDKQYFRCATCRALVKDQQLLPDPLEEKTRYLLHNNDVDDKGYQKFTAPLSNYILNHFNAEHAGLDFGSGPGPVISKALREKNYQVQQYDPFFANDLKLLNQKYDYIFACEVAEHFYDPEKEFKRLRTMLQPGGTLLLMTLLYSEDIPFRNWHYRKDPTHVFIYTRQTFDYIKKHFKFRDIQIEDRLIILKIPE